MAKLITKEDVLKAMDKLKNKTSARRIFREVVYSRPNYYCIIDTRR